MSELVGNIILERYRVDTFLGRGGMADVYQVWDQARSTYLAMKVLDPKLARDGVFVASFRQEAETLRTIQHPNIVRFYSLEESKKLVFMLMEFVDGQTLRQEILRISQPFDSQEVIRIMRPVCAALNYAHRLGFVHCDIKPSNIMLHTNGTVLLADFGISRVAGRASGKLHGVGTPAYMAPEQIEGEIPRPTMDIYSIGILLFEILTGGKRPFTGQYARTQGETTEKIRWEQRNLSPPSPRQYHPAISASLEAVVLRCLEKRPERRFETILHLQSALEEALINEVSQSIVPAAQLKNETPLEKVSATSLSTPGRNSHAKVFWLGISILIPILIVFALILGSRQSSQNSVNHNVSSQINTTTTSQTPVHKWDIYENSRLGFSLEHPPDWVYREKETNPVVVIASSQAALSSQGFVSNGAAVALAYTFLEEVDLPSTVDITSPGSVLDHFMNENFNSPDRLGAAEAPSIDGFPAASAVFTTYDPNQDTTIVLYGVAVVTSEALTLMLGICSETEWSQYRPVFERMRDSLKLP